METKTTRESPDGQRLATVVREDGKEFVVLDGTPQRRYDYWIEKDSLTFSPDSKHLAYVVRDTGGEFVVLDGRRQRPLTLMRSWSLASARPILILPGTS
jgi:hypothetical protein